MMTQIPLRTCQPAGTAGSRGLWTWTSSLQQRSWSELNGWRSGSASSGRSGWMASQTSQGPGASTATTKRWGVQPSCPAPCWGSSTHDRGEVGKEYYVGVSLFPFRHATGAVWMDSNKAFPASFSLIYCYHPSSRTLSGLSRGGCQLHFLVPGKKVTITVLPWGAWNSARCGTSAPLLDGEGSCPGFGVHLGFLVSLSWGLWENCEQSDKSGKMIWEERGRCILTNCLVISEAMRLTQLKPNSKYDLLRTGGWGEGDSSIVKSSRCLDVCHGVFSYLWLSFHLPFQWELFFFFFTDTSGIKSFFFFFLSLFSLLAPIKHNPTHFQQWNYGNVRDVSVTGEKLTTSKRLKRVFFLFCLKYIYIYIWRCCTGMCLILFVVVVKLQFSYG